MTARRFLAVGALCAFAGFSLAATFARDTTTPVDVGVTEYQWNVAP